MGSREGNVSKGIFDQKLLICSFADVDSYIKTCVVTLYWICLGTFGSALRTFKCVRLCLDRAWLPKLKRVGSVYIRHLL